MLFNKIFASQYDLELHPFALTGTGTPAFTFGSTSFSSITDNGTGDYTFSLKNSRSAGVNLWCFAYARSDAGKLFCVIHNTDSNKSTIRIKVYSDVGTATDALIAGIVIVKRSAREV